MKNSRTTRTNRSLVQWSLGIVLPVIFVAVTLSEIHALPDGSFDGLTGAPGEFSCGYTTTCHFGNPLNDIGGQLTLSGPVSYSPGDTLDIQINLAKSGQRRWGFMITAIDSRDSSAGLLAVIDSARTRYGTAINKHYIKQKFEGTDLGIADTAPGWSIQWIAPDTSVGDVIFHIAGNAANGNGAPSGDFIYTTKKIISAN